MNSKNSKKHLILIDQSCSKISLKKVMNMLLYRILAFTIHGKIFEKSNKNNKFEISAPTWNEEIELTDKSYSVSDVQDYFEYILTLFRMDFLGAAHGWTPLPKICHTHPTMMKLGTVIPYLKKIPKIYESRESPLDSR